MSRYSRRKFIALSGMLGVVQSAFSTTTIGDAPSNCKIRKNMPDLEKIKVLIKQDQPVIWLFTGDSITQGAKHTNGYRSYPEIFSERVRWEMSRRRDVIINTAISGNVTDNIISDFEWRVGQFKPAVVSLMIGTNDVAYPAITPDIFEKNLRTLVERIRSSGSIPVLHTPNFISLGEDEKRERLPEFVPLIKKVTSDQQVVLVDNWTAWSDTKTGTTTRGTYVNWLDDALHPNYKGHAEIAQLLFKTLDIFDVNAPTCK